MFLFSSQSFLFAEEGLESRKSVPTISGVGQMKHAGQDPKYLEKFIGADDDLEDFDVDPDVFYGVCPPAPFHRESFNPCLRTHIQVYAIGELLAVRVHRCVGPVGCT